MYVHILFIALSIHLDAPTAGPGVFRRALRHAGRGPGPRPPGPSRRWRWRRAQAPTGSRSLPAGSRRRPGCRPRTWVVLGVGAPIWIGAPILGSSYEGSCYIFSNSNIKRRHKGAVYGLYAGPCERTTEQKDPTLRFQDPRQR